MKVFAVRKFPPLEPSFYVGFYAKCQDANKRLINEEKQFDDCVGTEFDIEEIEVFE